MSKKPLIIYGTGNRASCALDIVREEYPNYEPVAYTSKRAEKVGKIIRDLPVLSREAVRQRYGEDFYLYISPAMPTCDEIREELLAIGYVPQERILNCYEREKYFSCFSLETNAIVTNEGIYYCCELDNIRNASPFVPWQETPEATVEQFIRQRDHFIEELQTQGKTNPCAGCPELKNTYWEKNRHISVLALSMSYPCHLGCIYCNLSTNARNLPAHREDAEKAKELDIPAMLKCLREKGGFLPSEPIQLSGGEITVSPIKEKVLSAVSPYPVQVFTTAVIYDEKIAELTARADGSFLNVSLDSGTKETYLRVKGLDAFERVKTTLRRYRKGGSNLVLKYILLPDNTLDADLDGFLELSAELQPRSVLISCNILVETKQLPQDVINGAVHLALGCRERKIDYTILPYFGEENLAKIHGSIEKNN